MRAKGRNRGKEKLEIVNKQISRDIGRKEFVDTVSTIYQDVKPFVDKAIEKGLTPDEAIKKVIEHRYIQAKYGSTFAKKEKIKFTVVRLLRGYYYKKDKANEDKEIGD